eukprot:scaffold43955_cov50-Attheya_sp.AAC.1
MLRSRRHFIPALLFYSRLILIDFVPLLLNFACTRRTEWHTGASREKPGMLLSHTMQSRLLFLYQYMDESLACIDRDYEHEMQRKHCSWIEQPDGQGTNHLLHRRWVLTNSNDAVLLRVASNGPTCISVHTHVRNMSDEARVNDHHPFVVMIYLLRNAETSSTVYVSAPFFTDMHIADELRHYPKPVMAGGRDVTIRVILGPQRLVTSELQRFVNAFAQQGRRLREEMIGRLAIRRFGTDNDT